MAMVVEGSPFTGHRGRSDQEFTVTSGCGGMEGIAKLNSMGAEGEDGDPVSHSRPMSALARGVQITEFAESRVNPTPLFLEESDILLEQYLSPGKLQLLTGVDNLSTVECLELKVDSRETSLGNFGSLLPNLQELKLSGSCISCVRDLGSSLRNLRVLWLTRCGLEELDGVSAMLQLVELYLQYNEISDLSPLSMLEQLEILDLEGNNIDDVTQVQYLSLCPRLRRLALDGNPICVYASPTQVDVDPEYDYRASVKSILPNLLVLDDERMDADITRAASTAASSSSDDKDSAQSRHHNVFDDDWAYLEELQQDAFLQQEFTEQGAQAATDGDRPPTGALRPATSYRPGSALRPSSGFRPLSASRRRPATMSPNTPGSQQGSQTVSTREVASSEGIESSSELTMGSVICGNPSKALRQRRHGGPGSKDEIRKGLNKLMQKGAVFSHSEGAEDEVMKAEDEMNNIIEELQSWKVDHDRRMKEILKTKEAQILVVDHDESVEVVVSEDEDIDDFYNTRMSKQIEEDSSPSSQRHMVDLRLKKKPTGSAPTSNEKDMSLSDLESAENYRRQSPNKQTSEKKNLSSESNSSIYRHLSQSNEPFTDTLENSDNDDNQNFRSKQEHQSKYPRSRRQSPHPPKDGQLAQSASSASYKLRSFDSQSAHETLEGLGRIPGAEQPRRPGSRSGMDGELAPLRAPSPTSAQIINSLRSRQQQQNQSPPTSPRPRKLRVGPTGLPLSSQSQQPVIRGGIVPPQARGIAGVSTPSSRPGTGGAVPLLPSQPRIARKLPETPNLPPRPPKQT